MAGGRPPKYKNKEEMQTLIDLYFLACRVHKTNDTTLLDDLSDEELQIINDIPDPTPTVSGLAYHLGMTTQALRGYEVKEEFLSTVKRAKQRIEMFLEGRLLGNNATGPIFNLKNNFGWKDKTEQEQLLNVSVKTIERTIVKAPDSDG